MQTPNDLHTLNDLQKIMLLSTCRAALPRACSVCDYTGEIRDIANNVIATLEITDTAPDNATFRLYDDETDAIVFDLTFYA